MLYSLYCCYSHCCVVQGTKGISTQTLKSLIYERGQTFRSQSQLHDLRYSLENQLKERVRDLQRSQGKSTPSRHMLRKNTHTIQGHRPHILYASTQVSHLSTYTTHKQVNHYKIYTGYVCHMLTFSINYRCVIVMNTITIKHTIRTK